jgi:TatD DNase family protein
MPYYVDVHTHLTHDDFTVDREVVIQRAIDAGLGAIVVNGLDPFSNRLILEMSKAHAVIKPALGIYPLRVFGEQFSVDEEIGFIESQVEGLIAIGECGLDGYLAGEETFAQQESVLERLADIAIRHNLPLIVHSRKLEKRTLELLAHLGVKKVDFHCFCGKSKLALDAASDKGWHFSIPANAIKSGSFQKLLKYLPIEAVLTETDAPYLSPEKFARNEPCQVVGTIALMAELRAMSVEEARDQVWKNYLALFGRA